ncbi:MAG: RNA chaperone Hfq [Clostridiales bacterium]|nr:RNA chaperone Hfq [Clostridiales bacterium]
MIPETENETKRNPIKALDFFLNKCRKEFTTVEIMTHSGEIIEGVIDCYDKDSIIIHNEMTQLMIFKHSICYISPRNGQRIIPPEKQKWDYDRAKSRATIILAAATAGKVN